MEERRNHKQPVSIDEVLPNLNAIPAVGWPTLSFHPLRPLQITYNRVLLHFADELCLVVGVTQEARLHGDRGVVV